MRLGISTGTVSKRRAALGIPKWDQKLKPWKPAEDALLNSYRWLPDRPLTAEERTIWGGDGGRVNLVPGTWRPAAGRSNDYLIDRAEQRTKSFTGIAGNRVLLDNAGPNILARFDRDVLTQTSVTHVIVLEGINDIGQARNNPLGPAGTRLLMARTGALLTHERRDNPSG